MKPVTMTVDGKDYVFRVPQMRDFLRLDAALPILHVETEPLKTEKAQTAAFKRMAEDPPRLLNFLERAAKMLTFLAIKPKMVEDFTLDPPDGTVPVDTLKDQDKSMIYMSLVGLSGYDEEAAVEIAPLSEAG